MSLHKSIALVLGCLFVACWTVQGAPDPPKKESPLEKINWVKGPGKGSLKNLAEINVPPGYMYTDAQGTQLLLRMMGNPTHGKELGFLAPTSMVWFVVFEFSAIGYVKDDDKNKLNADAMLKSIQAGTERSNEERKKMGVPPLHVTGWEQPPKYNEQTHNLEWAIRGESEGQPIVNYNTRLLGRKGVMEVALVVEPAKLTETLPTYQALLKDYSFRSGENYAEYKPGDKLAQYGLAALVTGGAAALAYKTGLLAKLGVLFAKVWKFLILAVLGVFAFFKRLIFGRNE